MKVFNEVIYNSQRSRVKRQLQHYDPFFYPLDSIRDWNRAYGKKGFLQYQCVIPLSESKTAMKAILNEIGKAGEGSFLAVFKVFGDIVSPGMLSFPRQGATLALDFPFYGRRTLEFLSTLDKLVQYHG
jgi:hypothetical protein